ncbi:ATP-binding protein, partial [Bacteroides nordii]|uniref:ATP-binding protein n=1 Tax=Bacteroides nordii TaxID=291645 RepID=UPI00189BAA15
LIFCKFTLLEPYKQLYYNILIYRTPLNVLYSQMANSINFLKEYALNHTEIKDHFLQLQTAFQHMETNYKLLQPLYRTTRRQKTAFDGEYLIKGMKAFFASKFSEHKILLEANDEFLNYQFFTYEPVITSVFINIINNAIYWLIPALSRKIRIEYLKESNEILIINNGEKIDDKMLADIFTLFFTRKKGGRGIGLYLARKSLRSIDYDIFATNDKKYNKLNGACFVIHTFNKQN